MSLLAGLLLAVAAALVLTPRAKVRPMDGRTRTAPSRHSPLRRLRLPLTVLAASAAWTFVGWPVGAVAALGVGVLAWRVLGSVESPASRRRRQQLQRDLPFATHLLSVLVAGGADVAAALRLIGDAVGGALGEELRRIDRELAITRRPGEVWQRVGGLEELGPLGRALSRSYDSGAPVVEAVEHVAEDLTRSAEHAIEARVRTIEVRAAVPLGVCFLPAFAILGVLPLIVGTFSAMSFLR